MRSARRTDWLVVAALVAWAAIVIVALLIGWHLVSAWWAIPQLALGAWASWILNDVTRGDRSVWQVVEQRGDLEFWEGGPANTCELAHGLSADFWQLPNGLEPWTDVRLLRQAYAELMMSKWLVLALPAFEAKVERALIEPQDRAKPEVTLISPSGQTEIQILGCPRCFSDDISGDPEGGCWCRACDYSFWDSNGADLAKPGQPRTVVVELPASQNGWIEVGSRRALVRNVPSWVSDEAAAEAMRDHYAAHPDQESGVLRQLAWPSERAL